MPRIRTIKPGFFRSHEIAALPLSARLTFIGLWTYVDDSGRGVDDCRLVKGDLWQLDARHTMKKVEADLALLAARGHIERYERRGRKYLRVIAWKEHQRINRPSPSILPASLTEGSVNPHGTVTEPSREEGKGREKEKEGKGDDPAPQGLGVVVPPQDFARQEPPSLAASGDGSTIDTAIPPEQVELNVTAIRAARSRLRGESDVA